MIFSLPPPSPKVIRAVSKNIDLKIDSRCRFVLMTYCYVTEPLYIEYLRMVAALGRLSFLKSRRVFSVSLSLSFYDRLNVANILIRA